MYFDDIYKRIGEKKINRMEGTVIQWRRLEINLSIFMSYIFKSEREIDRKDLLNRYYLAFW